MEHFTNQYSWSSPVFRRGFPIVMSCSCEDSSRVNSLQVALRAGRATRGNSIKEFKAIYGYEIDGWTVRYETSNRRNMIIVTLNPPATAITGHYIANFYVDGRLRKTMKFLLFFNPWSREDPVYLAEEDKRWDYVLNTHTIIYMGTYRRIIPRGWYLGQFQTASVEAVLMILDRMPAEDRASPIKVARFLSAIVNANDDNGVVIGNWSGTYGGGVNPNAWNGSNAILAKFAKYRSSVRYGQCWVFCGVLCTVLRTCGIPTRCVTCYNSFHDHDGSLAWEMYFNRFMRPVHFRRQESMWNYHCWNEAWMDRKDLSPGHGGWQVVDSTPQERSQGFYRCGPASQAAVKAGNVDLPYDTGFVFAEVNADKIFYYQRPGGGFVVGRIDRQIVGRNLSCKAVGSNHREDVTSSYKYPDNSEEEKIIQGKINAKRRRVKSPPNSPVRVDISTPYTWTYKRDCAFNVKLRNISNGLARTKFRLSVTSVSYRGRIVATLLNEMYQMALGPNSEKEFQQVVTSNQLRFGISNDSSSIRIEVNGLVNERDFLHGETVVEVDTPKISIYGAPDVMRRGTIYRVNISITNPLSRPLTNAKLLLSGDVLVNGRGKIIIGTISREGTFDGVFEVMSKFKGEYYVYATLKSNEISGFERYAPFKFS